MSVSHRAEEYPEHLNPFHSRKNSFKESIRGLRNTLVRSFRGHDKKRPEIRRRQDTTISPAGVHPSRHTLSVIPRTQTYETPVLLPRSRFSERVPKEKPSPSQADETKEQNPFEENDLPPAETEAKIEVNPPEVITPTPTERKRIRRRKKRAPIPPNANGDLTVPSSMNGSKWSLVSTDTEFSSTCPSDYEPDYVPPEIEPGKVEEILQLTEEIQKLTDKTDSSLNVSNSINEIPQETSPIVVPSNDSVDPKIDKVPQETSLVVPPSDTNEISSEPIKDKEESNTGTKNEIILKTPEATLQINDTNNDKTEPIDVNKTITNDLDSTDYQIQLRDDLAVISVDDQSTKTNEKIITDDHNNNTEINALHNSKCDIQMIDDDEGLNYSESQSIVFAYTKDERNEEKFLYRERRSISLSGSRDELQNVDDSIVGRRIEQFEASSSPIEGSPSPKVRKSIPTKENLLG